MEYAENLPYWQSSTTSPDTWITKAQVEIQRAGGTILSEGYGAQANGKAAFMLAFELQNEEFRILWPVLESKTGKMRAAKIQATTMLYHDVKSRCVAARVLGARSSFMPFLVLPDGRTASQVATPELTRALPQLLIAGSD